MRPGRFVSAALIGSCFVAAPAGAFSIYGPSYAIGVAESPRWTPERLAGGLRVGVDASFAAAWSPTTTDAAVVEGWVQHAFDVWENAALQFDVRFGDLAGADIVLQALPGDDPLGGFYGSRTPPGASTSAVPSPTARSSAAGRSKTSASTSPPSGSRPSAASRRWASRSRAASLRAC